MEIVLKISDIIDYREYDRLTNPTPKILFIKSYSIDEHVQYVSNNEIDPIELTINGDHILITDGNNRLTAAHILNTSHIVVNVQNLTGKIKDVFHDHTIKRFKKANHKLSQILNIKSNS